MNAETTASEALPIPPPEMRQVLPPRIRHFQWTVVAAPSGPDVDEVEFPADEAPEGAAPAPHLPVDANLIGLDDER
jgi:hypothetical protein